MPTPAASGGGAGDLLFAYPDGAPLRHGQWWHAVWLPMVTQAGLGKCGSMNFGTRLSLYAT